MTGRTPPTTTSHAPPIIRRSQTHSSLTLSTTSSNQKSRPTIRSPYPDHNAPQNKLISGGAKTPTSPGSTEVKTAQAASHALSQTPTVPRNNSTGRIRTITRASVSSAFPPPCPTSSVSATVTLSSSTETSSYSPTSSANSSSSSPSTHKSSSHPNSARRTSNPKYSPPLVPVSGPSTSNSSLEDGPSLTKEEKAFLKNCQNSNEDQEALHYNQALLNTELEKLILTFPEKERPLLKTISINLQANLYKTSPPSLRFASPDYEKIKGLFVSIFGLDNPLDPHIKTLLEDYLKDALEIRKNSTAMQNRIFQSLLVQFPKHEGPIQNLCKEVIKARSQNFYSQPNEETATAFESYLIQEARKIVVQTIGNGLLLHTTLSEYLPAIEAFNKDLSAFLINPETNPRFSATLYETLTKWILADENVKEEAIRTSLHKEVSLRVLKSLFQKVLENLPSNSPKIVSRLKEELLALLAEPPDEQIAIPEHFKQSIEKIKKAFSFEKMPLGIERLFTREVLRRNKEIEAIATIITQSLDSLPRNELFAEHILEALRAKLIEFFYSPEKNPGILPPFYKQMKDLFVGGAIQGGIELKKLLEIQFQKEIKDAFENNLLPSVIEILSLEFPSHPEILESIQKESKNLGDFPFHAQIKALILKKTKESPQILCEELLSCLRTEIQQRIRKGAFEAVKQAYPDCSRIVDKLLQDIDTLTSPAVTLKEFFFSSISGKKKEEQISRLSERVCTIHKNLQLFQKSLEAVLNKLPSESQDEAQSLANAITADLSEAPKPNRPIPPPIYERLSIIKERLWWGLEITKSDQETYENFFFYSFRAEIKNSRSVSSRSQSVSALQTPDSSKETLQKIIQSLLSQFSESEQNTLGEIITPFFTGNQFPSDIKDPFYDTLSTLSESGYLQKGNQSQRNMIYKLLRLKLDQPLMPILEGPESTAQDATSQTTPKTPVQSTPPDETPPFSGTSYTVPIHTHPLQSPRENLKSTPSAFACPSDSPPQPIMSLSSTPPRSPSASEFQIHPSLTAPSAVSFPLSSPFQNTFSAKFSDIQSPPSMNAISQETEKVYLSGNIPGTWVEKMPEKCPQVKEVVLRDCTHDFGSDLMSLKELQQLTSLSLSNVTIQRKNLIRLFSRPTTLAENTFYWPDLQTIELSNLAISDQAIAQIAQLPTLRSLTINGCIELTNQALLSLGSCCTLKELTISNTPGIDSLAEAAFRTSHSETSMTHNLDQTILPLIFEEVKKISKVQPRFLKQMRPSKSLCFEDLPSIQDVIQPLQEEIQKKLKEPLEELFSQTIEDLLKAAIEKACPPTQKPLLPLLEHKVKQMTRAQYNTNIFSRMKEGIKEEISKRNNDAVATMNDHTEEDLSLHKTRSETISEALDEQIHQEWKQQIEAQLSKMFPLLKKAILEGLSEILNTKNILLKDKQAILTAVAVQFEVGIPEEIQKMTQEKLSQTVQWVDSFIQAYFNINRVAWAIRKELLEYCTFENPGRNLREILIALKRGARKIKVLDFQNLELTFLPNFLKASPDIKWNQLEKIDLQGTDLHLSPNELKEWFDVSEVNSTENPQVFTVNPFSEKSTLYAEDLTLTEVNENHARAASSSASSQSAKKSTFFSKFFNGSSPKPSKS